MNESNCNKKIVWRSENQKSYSLLLFYIPIEQRENLESSMNQNLSSSLCMPKRFGSRDGLDDSTDTMEQLNQMISKFESLSSTSASKKSGSNSTATLER